MTPNEHLDRAIVVAQERVFNNQERVVDPLDRTYARALIAYIVNHLAEDKPMSTQAAFGYGMALDDLREIAGIQPEKVYEHNDGN